MEDYAIMNRVDLVSKVGTEQLVSSRARTFVAQALTQVAP